MAAPLAGMEGGAGLFALPGLHARTPGPEAGATDALRRPGVLTAPLVGFAMTPQITHEGTQMPLRPSQTQP
jgi:hypothetical protein